MNNRNPRSRGDHDSGQKKRLQGPLNMRRLLIWLLFGIMLAFWARYALDIGPGGPTQISYSDFREQLQSDNIERVVVQGDQIEGRLKESAQRTTEEGETRQYRDFVTYLPSFGDDELLSMLESKGVEVETRPAGDDSFWPILLTTVLPILVLIGIGVLIFRQMRARGANLFSVGQSKAKLYDRRMEQTTFDDVAGLEGPKEELREIIEFLKYPERFEQLGGEVPKGVLLVGPPGTGKTLLARAVAGEADAPFFIVTGSDFMEMFVGVGASRVRDLFSKAKEAAPAIIFIDELDSIGRRRGAGLGRGHDEREQTLNQLLSELDGFEPTESVIVMAATNRPDILDPALMRPGRFDRRVTVPLPSKSERHEILSLHARNKPLAEDVDLERIARGTPGFSGADLDNLLNEAALLAARHERKRIQQKDVDEARDKIMMGLERRGLALTDDERRLLAFHEAGHALMAASLPNTDPIHKVTIVPRGRAMGTTQQLPEREQYVHRREYMLDRIAVMMGGRAAEHMVFDTATSGAENDLKQATRLARKMVLDWGMSEKLGPMASGGQREEIFLGEELGRRRSYSEDTAREIDQEVRAIIDEAYKRALDTLRDHRRELERIAELLLEREEIEGDEVTAILENSE